MQRKALRATVGGADVDVPISTFIANQFVFFDGTYLVTQVAVRVSGTPVTGHLAGWLNAETIVDANIIATNVVTTTATPSANQIATFTGTGKAIQPVTVTVSGGAIASVTTINGTSPGSWVVGPGSATNGVVAAYSGTTGKLIQNTSVLATDIVTNSAAATSGNVAIFNGSTGKIIFDSPAIDSATLVTSTSTPSANQLVRWTGTGKTVNNTTAAISGSTLSGITVVDGVTIASHGVRHVPGGADEGAYYNGFNWRQNVVPMYRGNTDAQIFYPMHLRSSVCASMTLNSTFANPAATGTLIYAWDSGGSDLVLSTDYTADYLVEWNFVIDCADSITGDLEFKPLWTGGSGTAILTLCGAGAANVKYSTATGTVLAFTITGAPTGIFSVRCTLGITGCPAGNDTSIQMRKTSGTGTVIARGTCFAKQVSVNV